MNAQTKYLRKLGFSSKVMKGVHGSGEGGAEKKGSLTFHRFDAAIGLVNSAFGAPGNLHKSARKGPRSLGS